MNVLAPILLLLGSLYSWYMAAYYLWQASYHSGNEKAVHFCAVWFYVYGAALIVSLLSWVGYALLLWRRKSPTMLCCVYLGLWVVLIACGLWVLA
ncbi:MAG: hypothetical protein IJB33_07580 [Akkermansia sp.]|nr:hypothetical protein [Akkermansia sp.]MBQ7024215.1 hypothetical protein [Akkermansia sp.]